MASLTLTSASPIGYLEYPSVHHKKKLVVGVFGKTRTLFNSLIYRVGLLDEKTLLVDWGKNVKYTEGHYPNAALIGTHVEGEAEQQYYVVETHQSQVLKKCYCSVGKVNKDLRTINFGPDTPLCDGVNPQVCAKDDKTVIVISEKPFSRNILQYRIGQVDVSAKTIKWREMCIIEQFFGICPSVSMSEDTVVVACVCGSKLQFIVGKLDEKLQDDKIDWGAAMKGGVGGNPSISVNSRGHVVEVHKNGLARRLFYSIGECHDEEKIIVWKENGCSDREYTLGLFPSISLADDGSVIECHRTNCGYQSYLSCGELKIADAPDGQVDQLEIEEGR